MIKIAAVLAAALSFLLGVHIGVSRTIGLAHEMYSVDGDFLDHAWGIIANAGGGNWATQSPEWQAAAESWRDAYFQRP